MAFRAVILAAGASKRTGAQKLLLRFRGRMLIDYAIRAAQHWRPLVVAGTAVADALKTRDDVSLVVNDQPQRGMAHSLVMADAALPKKASLIVLLADKPLVSGPLIRGLCVALGSADVAYPVHSQTGEPGHPVVFSARVRPAIATLSNGDTLHILRDDPSFRRRVVPTTDEGAFFDVDTIDTLDDSAAESSR
jgi:molybdenum cofactor cytidylyltransferase